MKNFCKISAVFCFSILFITIENKKNIVFQKFYQRDNDKIQKLCYSMTIKGKQLSAKDAGERKKICLQ